MKLNRKGFMLAEVVVVSVVIALVLVTLFTALNRLSSAFETRNRYHDVDAAYLAMEVNNILIEDSTINTLINNDVYMKLDTNIDNVTIYKEFIVDELLVYDFSTFYAPYPIADNEILNMKNIEEVSQTFKDYIDYLNGNLDYSNEYNYIIVSELCHTKDDCYYYTLKVR